MEPGNNTNSTRMNDSEARTMTPEERERRRRRKEAMLKRKRRARMRKAIYGTIALVCFIVAAVMFGKYFIEQHKLRQGLETQQGLENLFAAQPAVTENATEEPMQQNDADVQPGQDAVRTPEATAANDAQETPADNDAQGEPTDVDVQDEPAIVDAQDEPAADGAQEEPAVQPAQDESEQPEQAENAGAQQPEIIEEPGFAEQETITDVVRDFFVSDRFLELMEINNETIGWMIIDDIVNTPLVFRDNDYYMNHDFYGEESSHGTVFIDEKNVLLGVEKYKVYYGHNMRDGSMFGRVDEYKDLEFLKEHTDVEILDAYNNRSSRYVPFAVIDASMNSDNRHYFYPRRFDMFAMPEDVEQINAFIDEINQRSMYDMSAIDVTAEDNLICLVTCTYDLPNARLLLFCRELREGEDPAALNELIRNTATVK